jgi:opacity protein-like surface antigen
MKFQVQGFNVFLFFLLFTICFSLLTVSFAAHPLITDDTGTQGRGKFQLEINGETGCNKEEEEGATVKETGSEVAAGLSYGVLDNLDVVVGLPYQWNKVKEDGDVTSDEDGISDMSLEVKWMFYERNGMSLALKPGLTLPTGDDEKGLGAGRMTYSMFFITTKEIEPLAFHFNAGYIRNENKADDRKDIWHVSLASEVEAVNNLKLVANLGMEKNPDKSSSTDLAFILGGLIYSVSENYDIDFGIKFGLNKPETDRTLLAGMAVRF